MTILIIFSVMLYLVIGSVIFGITYGLGLHCAKSMDEVAILGVVFWPLFLCAIILEIVSDKAFYAKQKRIVLQKEIEKTRQLALEEWDR
jgi:uncharacterized membrane protein YedE/YeeE